MKLMKRILIHILIILILSMACLSVYYSSKNELPVYADTNTDSWTQVTTNQQLVEAFRYYCKSRDLTIDGSIADGVTQFTTKTFNGICNTLGIDLTALQAQIKYQTDGNLGNRFLFSTLGIDAYNRIFAQFLQDNNLQVGDSVDNEIVYSGYLYTDLDGISCFVTFSSRIPSNGSNTITSLGTPYRNLSYDTFNNYVGSTITANNKLINGNNGSYNMNIRTQPSGNNLTYLVNSTSCYTTGSSEKNFITIATTNGNVGYIVIAVVSSSTKSVYYVGSGSTSSQNYQIDLTNKQNCNITLNTVNVINNNNYEGDTIINNYGTPSQPVTPEPDYNPYPDGGGTTTGPSSSGGGSGEDDTTITFPSFDFHFPEIDWSIGDLSEKFPFSIPFDLVAFFTILNAEPQTPEIEGDLNLSIINHHFHFDLHQFDDLASLLRNVEFIGFCLALILLTRNMLRV